MTQQLTPPPELLKQWEEVWFNGRYSRMNFDVLIPEVFQAGADQELEACCEWMSQWAPLWPDGARTEDELRAARRPKPPSLKEQALEAMREMQIEPCIINGVDMNAAVRAKYETIRRALEQLDD